VPSGEVPSYHRAMAAEIAYTVDRGERLVNETFGPNEDPATPPDAYPRQSIEARTLAFF